MEERDDGKINHVAKGRKDFFLFQFCESVQSIRSTEQRDCG